MYVFGERAGGEKRLSPATGDGGSAASSSHRWSHGYHSEAGVSVVLYAGKARLETDMPNVLSLHRKIVEDTVNNENCNITGILIGQGTSVLHLLEGPCLSVLHILSCLADSNHFAEHGIQSGRIVSVMEDRPERYYPEWYSCTIQERRSNVEEVTSETSKDVSFELSRSLQDIGKGLQNAEGEVELDKFADRLPGKALVIALSASDDFFTLQEFVSFYSTPYHVELESEQCWPAEPVVKY